MIDIREFLATLPVTVAHGIDYKKEDWFGSSSMYPFYVKAARLINPHSILEIGVHLGFGSASFLKGSLRVSRLTCCDNESYIPGSQGFAAQNLAWHPCEKTFVSDVSQIPHDHYDLIHVDGDHSLEGALSDMRLAWRLKPKAMLIDDFIYAPEVARAVYAFAEEQGLTFKVWHSLRGWAVFSDMTLPEAL